jgi:hypothetical protein
MAASLDKDNWIIVALLDGLKYNHEDFKRERMPIW